MKSLALNAPREARGMVLIVVLVMLGILTLIVATLVRTGNINFQIAGNQQYRQEARLAAQSAIESYISVPANFDTPPSVPPTYSLDLDGDGTNEYAATVTPAVKIGVTSAPLSSITDPELRQACTNELNQGGSPAIDSGAGTSNNDSNCENVVYDVQATVDDQTTTGVLLELHQGISRLSKIGS